MLLLALIFLDVVYLVSFFFVSIRTGVAAPHYFLGYGRRLFSFKALGVAFSVGLYLPVIGLSKIAVMENGEKLPMKYPWEFFDQSLAKRWLATLSGAIGLFFTGMIMLIAITYFDEEFIITKQEVNRNGIDPSKMAMRFGFQRGDKIIALNGRDFVHYYELIDPKVVSTPNTSYTIQRGDRTIDASINIPIDSLDQSQPFFSLLVPYEIGHVMTGGPADKAGLLSGDRITKVNGHSVIRKTEIEALFTEDSDGLVTLTVGRGSGNSLNTFDVNVALDDEKKIGVFLKESLTYTSRRNTLLESIIKGSQQAFTIPVIQLKALGKIFSVTPTSKKALGGPVRIASAFGGNNWLPVAFLAVDAILLNMLPLPKSAFWEMVPLIYEGVSRKRFPLRLFQTLRKIAIAILILLMILVFVSDLSAFF